MKTAPRTCRRRLALAGTWLAVAGSLGLPVLAADDGSALQGMLVRDAKASLQLRSYYLDRNKPGGVTNEAWAGGGWLSYQSGWLGNLLGFGLTAYTSQPLWAPDDADGTTLLAPGQQGYSVLGEAWLSLKFGAQVASAGRFAVSQAEVNLQDNRMTPNTFEGGHLRGKVGAADYYLGYLTGIKTRNSEDFVDMASAAGAPAGVSSPLWLFNVGGSPVKDLKLGFSAYHVADVLASAYADAVWSTPLSASHQLKLSGQTMYQTSTGNNALTGAAFSTNHVGLKADLSSGPATLTAAYSQTGRGDNYRTPYGAWTGYESMIITDFNKAGMKAFLIGGSVDFAPLGAAGLALNVNAVWGRDAINPASTAAVTDDAEYDLTLDYRFAAKTWPEWVRPLWIRARAGRLEQELGATTNVTTDYRIIVNYLWTFK